MSVPTDQDVVAGMANADYRAGYLESTLRTALSAMQGARAALTGKRHAFARDILDRDIAGAEEALRFCEEAKKDRLEIAARDVLHRNVGSSW
jgi:hypothetical protein